MAQETGVIKTVLTATTGSIQRNSGAVPNPVSYDDPTLVPRNITLSPDEAVGYDIDLDAVVTNVTPAGSDPDFPKDEDYPGATIITAPVGGDLSVNGGVTIVKGTIVNGSVTITNNGVLILKSTDETGTQRARVTGSVNALANGTANLNIYKSDVNGSITFFNNNECKIKGGTVGGDGDIRNGAKLTIKGGTVGGDGDIRNMKTSVNIDGLTLTGIGKNLDVRNNKVSTVVKNIVVNNGDVNISNNKGCSYSNITAPNGNVDITGCTAI